MQDLIELAMDGRYYKAKALFEADSDYMRYPDAMSAYALCIAAVDRDYEGAKKLCMNALKHDTYNADIYHNLGRIFLIGNRKDLALKAFQKGLKLDRSHMGIMKETCTLGLRRRPVVPFLSRRNVINRILGVITYRYGLDFLMPVGVLTRAGLR
jgi:tetratricopeptide (TPR) repeat protein